MVTSSKRGEALGSAPHARRRWWRALAGVWLATCFAGCPGDPIDPTDVVSVRDIDVSDDDVDTGELCTTNLLVAGFDQSASVHVAGPFNDWSQTASPLTKTETGWSGELALAAGHHPYKLVINGQFEGEPPDGVLTHWFEGVENRDLYVADCALPHLEVRDASVSPTGLVRAEIAFVPGRDGSPLDPGTLLASVAGDAVAAEFVAADSTILIEFQAPKPGKYTVRAIAADTEGRAVEDGTVVIPLWYEEQAWDWRDATIYLAFVDRFRDSDGAADPVEDVADLANYQGGDFRGVTEAIEAGYFQELGVNTLWLSPIYENADGRFVGVDGVTYYSAYHGYWPVAFDRAEKRFADGSADPDDRLRELIAAAHDKGMRVLFDVVLNHVHAEHTVCAEAPAWCTRTCVCGSSGCGWDDLPLTCQFADYLPDLNFRDHAIVRRLVRETVDYAMSLDVDGFRVDAAKHMDDVIIETLAAETRGRVAANGGADVYLVGETFTGGDGYEQINRYIGPAKLDGQFDFPLYYAARDAFAYGGSFRDLETKVVTSEQAYGDAMDWMSPFIGNHDVSRFATAVIGDDRGPFGGSPDPLAAGPATAITEPVLVDKLALAYAFVLTSRGLPLLYYGDEIGLAGSGDPDNRRMLPPLATWNANRKAVFDRVAALGQARRASLALRRGERQELWIDDDVYVYARHLPDETVIVALNKAGVERSIDVTVLPRFGRTGATLYALVGDGDTKTLNGDMLSLTLPATGYQLWTSTAP